jgi:K+-transporting ATPase KdpF subunit
MGLDYGLALLVALLLLGYLGYALMMPERF